MHKTNSVIYGIATAAALLLASAGRLAALEAPADLPAHAPTFSFYPLIEPPLNSSNSFVTAEDFDILVCRNALGFPAPLEPDQRSSQLALTIRLSNALNITAAIKELLTHAKNPEEKTRNQEIGVVCTQNEQARKGRNAAREKELKPYKDQRDLINGFCPLIIIRPGPVPEDPQCVGTGQKRQDIMKSMNEINGRYDDMLKPQYAADLRGKFPHGIQFTIVRIDVEFSVPTELAAPQP